MKSFMPILLALSYSVAASPLETAAAEVAAAASAQCIHNNDAGRWDDPLKPSDRAYGLCLNLSTHPGQAQCYQASIGHMCISGSASNSDCYNLYKFAQAQESWHGNWFLWSAITCGNLALTITS